MSALLEVRSLSKHFLDGDELRPVLHGLDFEARAGEVIALMGPSGSGKSTLLNLLTGILRPDAGSIELKVDEGLALQHMDEAALRRLRRRHLGYVFQFFNLIPTLTVRENVLLPLELNGLEQLAQEAVERLVKLGLEGRLDDFPAHLSGGERQRTAIARALAHRPALILADEPTGNLDAANAEQVVDLLLAEVRALPCALIMATHSEAIGTRADRLLRLDELARTRPESP
ncbi:MAG: ABC transporter ATP-binding protein [Pseudomonadota bacterium]